MIRWLLLAFCGTATAQTPDPRVDWAASWSNPVTLELTAHVEEGWHVYALTQRPGGPIPLRVSIDDNPVASPGAPPSGSTPETRLDPSFNLQTEFYTNSFAVHVPVSLKSNASAGQSIPVSIRFQACSARECKPPKTVHLVVVHP
ncbi:MAG: protein-disulfide reductase DsbD domain-containing protein [Steroidobacteraceae bacterium]